MTPRLRVALVVSRCWPWQGGVESHVGEVSRRLVQQGVEVEVFTHSDGSLPRVSTQDGYLVRRFRLPHLRTWEIPAPALFAVLRQERARFDLIHAHNLHMLPALGAAAVAGRTPFVLTTHYHGTGHTPVRAGAHYLYRPLAERIVQRADAIIAVSNAEARLIARQFGQDAARRITIIPNGVARISLGRPFSRPRATILTCARLEAYKRVDLLVRGVAGMGTDVELVVVGDGPERSHLTELARSLGVEDRVVLLGRISDAELARWRATARVYAAASKHEAFGLTLGEALASGLAVVASDIPAHREVVAMAGSSARARFVALDSRADVGAWTAQLSAALADESSTGPFAKEPARLQTWDEVADTTYGLYEQLLTRRSTHTKRTI